MHCANGNRTGEAFVGQASRPARTRAGLQARPTHVRHASSSSTKALTAATTSVTPTAAQFADPTLRPLIDKYIRGAGVFSAEDRARVFRLGWDFAGSALASRNEQYERFYLTSGARNRQAVHLRADRSAADRLVDRFLSEPS